MLAVSVLAQFSPNSQSVLLKLVSVVHYNSLHNNRFFESVESHCIVIEYLQSNNNQEKCLEVTSFYFSIQSPTHPHALIHLAPDINSYVTSDSRD